MKRDVGARYGRNMVIVGMLGTCARELARVKETERDSVSIWKKP